MGGGGAKPSPVALEPLAGGKSAILSLVMRLPTGDEDWTPPGQSGVCMASTLVCLGGYYIGHVTVAMMSCYCSYDVTLL